MFVDASFFIILSLILCLDIVCYMKVHLNAVSAMLFQAKGINGGLS